MNPWDIFTWISAVVLGVSGLLIFVFFMKDAGAIIGKERKANDKE
ncbi:MAG: hypothetical protein ACR2QU_05755 [Gammaproteobacteria bacterium]